MVTGSLPKMEVFFVQMIFPFKMDDFQKTENPFQKWMIFSFSMFVSFWKSKM